MRGEPALFGHTVVIVGGSAGIGLETARRARAEGAEVVLTARSAERLERAAKDVGAKSTSAVDARDPSAVVSFFRDLTAPIDHVLLTGPGPNYRALAEITFEEARLAVSEHLVLAFWVARHAAPRIRPGGSITLMGGTGARRPRRGLALVSAVTAAMPALTAGLALEYAPVRVNLIAAGFVDTPLSASLLGDQLDRRRQELRDALPIRRVVEPEDVAALAVHLMSNTALTGGTYDIDGGQQLVGTSRQL